MARPADKRTCGIYAMILKPTGHMYVGSALWVEKRERSHWASLEGGTSHNKVMQFAYDVFGKENFEFVILEECKEQQLQGREKYHIQNNGHLFNILKDGRRPQPLNSEARKRLSERAKQQHRVGNLGRQTWRKAS